MANGAIEELKNLVDEERYEEAAALLPSVKERNAKSVSEMMALAKMLGKTGEYEKAEKLYLKAYKKRPSRLVLKDIMQMFIEGQMADDAENYYNQYIDLTPGDTVTKLGAKYRIEKIRGTEAGYLIGLLNQLKEYDYSEEYGYELCKQLYKTNDEQGCRAECSELIEAFPNSKEAEKARKLLAVMNGEISADEIKKKSGMPAWQSPAISAKEINTKDLPTIEFSPENEEPEDTERSIAESVQNIISESTVPDTEELENMLKDQVLEEDVRTEESVVNHEPEAVPVHIYAELYTPQCILGKEDFTETKARNIISSKKIKIEEIFGQFFRNTTIRRQIYNCLELAMIDKSSAWIIVAGEEKTGRTYFAKKLMFCMFSMDIISTKKVAVTNASVINRMTSEEVYERTGGSNIIVENAGDLTEQGIKTLKNLKLRKKEKICIVLEDTESSFATFIKNLLSTGIGLNNRVHLPKYTTEDLLGFVYDYVNEKDYGMEKVAADLVVSCINSTRAQTQGERYMQALNIARQSVETADARIAPDVLKMAAEAAFQEYYSLTIIREDITP